MFNNSLWYWELGLQREGLLCKWGKVCCWVMSERHSCLTTYYGTGSLYSRGEASCVVKWRIAVESRVRGTHLFNNSSWYWKLGLQLEGLLCEEGKVCCWVMSERHSCLTTYYGIGSLSSRGKACCTVKERIAVESRVRDTHVLTTPYDIGSLVFRWKVCCKIKGS